MENTGKIRELNDRLGIPYVARIEAGNGGLPVLRITTRAVSGEVYLHGAQVTGWKPAGFDEVLFVSAKSHWEGGKAIRGGIPICFPWFRAKADDPKAPTHGFVRTKEWQLDSVVHGEDHSVTARLSTVSDGATKKWWPFDFRAEYRITMGQELTLELSVSNTGDSEFRYEEALHTYFRVRDLRQTAVHGLDGATYLDNRDGNRSKVQSGDLKLAAQTDNAYLNTAGPVEIVDLSSDRCLRTEKQDSNSTIVWNPWSDGAATLADLGSEEWRQMLCVEGGNIMDSGVTLEPGKGHTIVVRILAAPM